MAAQGMPLARITPERRALAVNSAGATIRAPNAITALTPQQKAAVIVRYLIDNGAALPLAKLPDHMQAALTEQMGQMRLVDRATLDQVLADFTQQLEEVGLAFSGGLEGALSAMDGHISAAAASRLRRLSLASTRADPWERLIGLPLDALATLIELEAVEVAAVVMSKLPVPKAADLMGRLAGERARRIAFAVSQTGNVDPETVRRIGHALLVQIDSQPPKAFEREPVERVGAILNNVNATTREDVLKGLEAEDQGFAHRVRKAIFTYAHVPQRVTGRDIPKIIRLVEQNALVTAMAHSRGKPEEEATEYILANISQRLAQSLREEMEERARAKIRDKEAEAAMAQIIAVIRQLEQAGEITMANLEEES